jgi:hypothetical protein
MKVGKTCGFRPDDEKLVDTFNLAMEATGADLTELCVRSIRHGLTSAVQEILTMREQAREKLGILGQAAAIIPSCTISFASQFRCCVYATRTGRPSLSLVNFMVVPSRYLDCNFDVTLLATESS